MTPQTLTIEPGRPTEVDPRPPAVATVPAEQPDGAPQWFAMAGMATVGMTGVRIAGWTASDLLFLAASGAIVLRLLTGTRRHLAPVAARRSSPGILIGLLVLSVGGLLATVFRSVEPAGSILALARVWYITIIWFWILRSVTTSAQTFRRLLLAAIVGAVAHSLIGIYQDVSGANAGAPGWGRSAGLADHFGDFGIAVGSMVPIVAVWRRGKAVPGRTDLWRIAALLVLLGGAASSGSITPFAALIIGSAVAVVAPKLVGARRRRSRRVAVPIIVALIAIGLVATGRVDLAVQTRFEEFTSGDEQTNASAETRVGQTEVALTGIIESPVVGSGFDSTSGRVSIDGRQTNRIHNFYFKIFYEAGVLGFLGLCLILVLTFRQGWQLLRYMSDSSLSWIPAGLLGSLVMVLVSALFGPVLYGRISWLPMALISALFGLGRAGLIPRAGGTAASS